MHWPEVRALLTGYPTARILILRDLARQRAWALEDQGDSADRIERYTALARLARRLGEVLERRP